jgi:MFS family permease
MLRDPARRNVVILALAQGLMMAGTSTLIAESALVGHMLAENKSLATLPLALQQLTVTAMTIPASLIMQRIGRRAGFTIGTLCGIAATLIATWGVIEASFPLFCAGVGLNGVYGAFGMYYRFAAVDGAGAWRSRAISYVMAGGVIAAVLGPEIAKRTQHLLDPHLFAGSFAALAVVAFVALVMLQWLDIPRPVAAVGVGAGRPLAVIARQPTFIVAVLGGMISYGGMSLVMNATPLAMIACGHHFEDSALVIQLHVAAMFLPAFWTGRIIERVGVLQVMISGAVLLLAAALIDLSGLTVVHFSVALMLLGLGWNFLFVGATTLVTTTYRPEEKARVQALNDFLVFGSVGTAALLAGIIHEAWGWNAVNLLLVPFAVVSFAACWWLRARQPAPAPI